MTLAITLSPDELAALCPMCQIRERFGSGRNPGDGWWVDYCSKRCARMVVSVAFLNHGLSPHLSGSLSRLERSELPE